MSDSSAFVASSLPIAVFDLSDRAFLRLTGSDRLRYLNGQLTQDLRRLTPNLALPACITNAKGRLQAVVWVSVLEEALMVDVDADLGESLMARLDRYIVADDVLLEDVSGQFALLHVTGVDPAEISELGDFPKTQAARLGETGWDVRMPLAAKPAVLEALGSRVASRGLWELLCVARGIPRWGFELGEDTLPPEAGLDLTHVDYHKGCYIGQETISRLKSVGHVNRSLVRLSGAAGQPLAASGAELRVAGDGQAVVGKITSAVLLPSGESAVLAYVKRGVEAGEFLSGEGGVFRRV